MTENKKQVALEPHDKCIGCDFLTLKPEACFVPDKLGTQYIDAPFCIKRNLHYDYIRKIDEGERDCRYRLCEGMT